MSKLNNLGREMNVLQGASNIKTVLSLCTEMNLQQETGRTCYV